MSDHAPDKIAPETVTLRAQPRPVTRLNRRTLAALVGGLSIAVLGATIWSLQPQRRGNGEQTELYNVDRVSKSEGLDALPNRPMSLYLGHPYPATLARPLSTHNSPLSPPIRPPATTLTMHCAKKPKRHHHPCSFAPVIRGKAPLRQHRRHAILASIHWQPSTR